MQAQVKSPQRPLRLYVVEYVDRGKTMVTVVEAVDKTVAQWLFEREHPNAKVVSVT
jgi:hypothetical protein